MIPSELNDLITGLKWLAEGGRPNAIMLQSVISAMDNDGDELNLDEALGWLDAIADGDEL
jgi:hypothetical protein